MSLSTKEMTLLGMGTALGSAITCVLSARKEGKRLPVASSGMAAAKGDRRAPTYHAGIIKAKPGMLEQYTQLHDHTWDPVMAKMYECNMRNFVVYFHEETGYMFHHWEYVGDDFDADMARCGSDPIINFWWSHCEPCQEPLHWKGPPPSQGGKGDPDFLDEWWSPMKMLNHCGGWATAYSQSWPNPDHVPANPHGKTSTLQNPPAVHNRPPEWTTPANNPFLAKNK